MSAGQSSSTQSAPPIPDISLICPPSDQLPKQLSRFPLATPAMYYLYLAFWHERNERFNNRTASHRFNYELILTDDEDGSCHHLLVPLAKAISTAREALMADLGVLEQSFEAWTTESVGGRVGAFGN